MTRYLVQRLLSALLTIWVTTVIVTMLIHAVPGDPVRIMYAQWQASPEQIEAVRKNLGLDKSVPGPVLDVPQACVEGRPRTLDSG